MNTDNSECGLAPNLSAIHTDEQYLQALYERNTYMICRFSSLNRVLQDLHNEINKLSANSGKGVREMILLLKDVQNVYLMESRKEIGIVTKRMHERRTSDIVRQDDLPFPYNDFDCSMVETKIPVRIEWPTANYKVRD